MALTVPHGAFEDEPLAVKIAQSIASEFHIRTNQKIFLHINSSIRRIDSDLNRAKSKSTIYRKKLTEYFLRVSPKQKNKKKIILFDIHCTPEQDFLLCRTASEKDETPCDIIILIQDSKSISLAKKIIKNLEKYLKIKMLWGSRNSILTEAKFYKIKALLIEFNEVSFKKTSKKKNYVLKFLASILFSNT